MSRGGVFSGGPSSELNNIIDNLVDVQMIMFAYYKAWRKATSEKKIP